MLCPMCEKGKVKMEKREFKMYGISLGKFNTEVCLKCGEEFFDEKVSEQINKKAKEFGLWGLEARTKVGISGNSLIIRISSKIVDFTGLKVGEEVTVHPESKEKIVVEH